MAKAEGQARERLAYVSPWAREVVTNYFLFFLVEPG